MYVFVILGAVFAPFPVVPSGLMQGDAATTAARIAASKTLYALGGAAELMVYASDVALALVFYDLLKPVSRSMSLLAAFFRLVYAAIAGANVANHFAPLLLMTDSGYATAFSHDQIQALVLAFVRLHTYGFDIALVFFGFHCIAAGYLILKSGFFPRILGVLMALGGSGYIINISASVVPSPIAAVLFPYVLIPAGIAEVSLAFWLLAIGVDVQRWNERAADAAGLGSEGESAKTIR
ncbi:MAG: DUF4386 domain-containing protein [Bryobacterales bacterium]|nr:DUF4386 domain-containing protein [Bryobacterales bacterium]